MGKKENKYEYTAVYIGRRLRVDGKVFQHFTRTDNGEEYLGLSSFFRSVGVH